MSPRNRLLRVQTILTALPPEDVANFNLLNWETCAMAHVARDPVLRAEGFCFFCEAPFYRTLQGWSAVASFFQMSEQEAKWLFQERNWRRHLPFFHTKPRHIISRITKLLESRP